MTKSTTIFEKVDKHFRVNLKKAEEIGFKKGYKSAMNTRWQEVLRGKNWLERLQLVFK